MIFADGKLSGGHDPRTVWERMSCVLELRLRGVYLLSVEEPRDYLFIPAGVVIFMEREQFVVHCVKSSHNLFRQAIYKFSRDELLRGVHYRDHGFRFEDLTETMAAHGWVDSASIPDVLRSLYEQNQRHLFFLKRVVGS